MAGIEIARIRVHDSFGGNTDVIGIVVEDLGGGVKRVAQLDSVVGTIVESTVLTTAASQEDLDAIDTRVTALE